MKGTAIYVLIYGETPAERKASLLHSIQLDREIIKRFTAYNKEGEFTESIALLRQGIKDSLNEIVQLKRWQRQNQYEDNQAYIPPSLKAKLDAMTDEEKEAYMERKAQLQAQIADLEYQMWEKENQKGVDNEG